MPLELDDAAAAVTAPVPEIVSVAVLALEAAAAVTAPVPVIGATSGCFKEEVRPDSFGGEPIGPVIDRRSDRVLRPAHLGVVVVGCRRGPRYGLSG